MNPGPLPNLDWLDHAIEVARARQQFKARMVGLTVQGSLATQASKLSDTLPRDLDLLMDLVQDPALPVEVRGKVVEVMLFRGALNEYTYEQMDAEGGGLGPVGGALEDEKFGFAERRQYQEAVRDAVFADPALFDELSKSKDNMPQGRSPGTEFMNTMLRDGGMYGSDDARQEFERQLEKFPAETRGRAMYHLVDAARNADVHLKGERRTTGSSWEVSLGVEPFSFGMGFGQQWDYVDDNHWAEVGNDIRREMNADMDGRDDEYKKQHEAGFRDAARRDGALPGE
jgi:hypothetical protein